MAHKTYNPVCIHFEVISSDAEFPSCTLSTCKIIQKEYLYFLAVEKSIHRVIVLATEFKYFLRAKPQASQGLEAKA